MSIARSMSILKAAKEKEWTGLEIAPNTNVQIQYDNNGAYVAFFMGGSNEKDILLTLVGGTGNTTTTKVVGVSGLTITDGSGTGVITIRHTSANTRTLYIINLNGNSVPFIIT